MAQDSAAERYRGNLQGEIDGAALYRALAEVEPEPRLADVYRRLAAVEEAHAEFWRRELGRIGARVPGLRPGWRTRALGFLARRFGPQFVLPTLSILERRDVGHYDRQPEAVAGGLPQDERSHDRVVGALAGALPSGAAGSTLARLEGRHRTGGNALRAAVLGANDGLVSNLSLIAGVAGACSMAMGEWLSMTSSRELAQRQIAIEADELAHIPEEEKEEMVLIYQAKGLDEAAARALAERLMADKDTALDTLVREELGIDPEELGGSAWTAAGVSFALFAAGAIFPVAPFFWLDGAWGLVAGVAASSVALLLIGAGTSLFTGRGPLFSAVRQLVIGLAAAGITFGIGRLVGASLGG